MGYMVETVCVVGGTPLQQREVKEMLLLSEPAPDVLMQHEKDLGEFLRHYFANLTPDMVLPKGHGSGISYLPWGKIGHELPISLEIIVPEESDDPYEPHF